MEISVLYLTRSDNKTHMDSFDDSDLSHCFQSWKMWSELFISFQKDKISFKHLFWEYS